MESPERDFEGSATGGAEAADGGTKPPSSFTRAWAASVARVITGNA